MDMTRKLILAAWALLLAAAVPAQQKEEFRLWPEAGKYAPERLGAGFDRDNAPYVTLYRPEGKKPAPAVVVCPGGAYGGLAIGHEGYQVAEWFAARGFAAVVLKYTMPHGNYDLPRRDVQQAIELVRANAAGWGVDPARVGVIGFSAGGHLASTAATHFTCDANRPDFAILVYPVITMDERFTHAGSRRNLLGGAPAEGLVAAFSNELCVTSGTPPTFSPSATMTTGCPRSTARCSTMRLKPLRCRARSIFIRQAGTAGAGTKPLNTGTSSGTRSRAGSPSGWANDAASVRHKCRQAPKSPFGNAAERGF